MESNSSMDSKISMEEEALGSVNMFKKSLLSRLNSKSKRELHFNKRPN